MPRLIELKGLRDAGAINTYIATIVADIDDNGVTELVDFGVVPGDIYGLAEPVRLAIREWKLKGKPIDPYDPPTADELRAFLPPLSRRRLMLGLNAIGISSGAIAAQITDEEDLIEWQETYEFSRLNPLLVSVADKLHLPPEQVDTLWNWAAAR